MHLYLVTIVYTCCLYMKKALFLAVPHLKVPPVGHGTSASFSPALVTCPSALIQPTGVIPEHQWSRRGVTSCQFHGMVGTYEIIGAKTEQRIACWAWHYGGKDPTTDPGSEQYQHACTHAYTAVHRRICP